MTIPDGWSLHRKSLGVVASITPWNWPVMIAIWHIVPALRAGNTVVIKPSPYTPLSTLRTVEVLNYILPPGVLNVVTSDDKLANIGALMSAHPDIRKVVFTGPCATGEKIMQSAARTMKRLTLEMGDNDAGIVLADCDPAAIAEGLFWGAFINNGQTCAAMKRLYVHDSIHDAVCDALVAYARNIPMGNGLDEANGGRDIVAYVGEKSADVNGRDSVVLQGHVIGGGSSVNAMIYIRGHANDYNQWAQLGNRGWSYDDVLPVFKDLEQNLTLADAFHGTAGELHVSEPRFKHPLCQAFVRAAQETGLPYNPDFNGKVQEGVGFYRTTTHDGRR